MRRLVAIAATLTAVAAGCGETKTSRVHPKRGDIVVFKVPRLAAARCGAGGVFVKRIVGLPGETWSERDGFVYVDGHRLSEPYIRPARRDHLTRPSITIPRDAYFVLGDNRSMSCDSRVWGPLPRASLVGTVVRIKRTG